MMNEISLGSVLLKKIGLSVFAADEDFKVVKVNDNDLMLYLGVHLNKKDVMVLVSNGFVGIVANDSFDVM